MSTSVKIMPKEEKENFCQNIYQKDIVKASEVLKKYEEYANTVRVVLPIGCYTNFRDALFHFRKLVVSVEEKEIECQAFAIKEHLSRPLTDAATSILDHSSFVAEKLLSDEEIEPHIKDNIRTILHKMKKANLRKRFSGMMLANDKIKISHNEMLELLDEFYGYMSWNCSKKYAKYSQKYKS